MQVTTTTIKSPMGSKFGKILLGHGELAAIELLGKAQWTYSDHSSEFTFGSIFFILAGNKDNHKSLDKFEF